MHKAKARTALRLRWLFVALAVAGAIVPVALMVSSTAEATGGVPFSNPAHPVVNTPRIYANNFYESTTFIYKVAGADGCLTQSSTCNTSGGGTQGDINDLPPNYNGSQEFNRWWGVQGSNHDADGNGPLGRFFSVRHNLWPIKQWALDAQQIILPGATCAGQQVMTSFHEDSTPWSSQSITTSLTPLSGMYSGDWGAGSAYDANMGANMNFEEIGSVLRWHEVNNTYPARTLIESAWDAELAGLVGSGDYSAAGGGATLLLAPASVGDTNIKVAAVTALNAAGTTGIFGVGQSVAIDDSNTENNTVASIGVGARGATALAAASAVGDTNIKVAGQSTTMSAASVVGATNIKFASATNILANTQLIVDTGGSAETVTITNVGTTGSGGTGLTVTPGLTQAHASGTTLLASGAFVTGEQIAIEAQGASNQEWATVQSIGTAGATGTGITLTAGLTKAHASGAAVQDLGTGVTLSQPLTTAHPVGSTVNGPTTGLISDSPQGQIVMVLNNDADGLDYPTPKWGTDHYMNDLVNGNVGPWFNNINATPVSPAANNIYGTVGIQRLQHNLPAVQAFRSSVATAVAQSFADLGQKYNFSVPLESPDLLKNTGSVPDNPVVQTRPAYSPGDQALYSPVLDDRTGRTDQVSFGVRGIPSLGDIAMFDSSTDPLVGGNENPYPAGYPSKPTLSRMYGYDAAGDYFSDMNFFASGTVHGGGTNGTYDQPSEGLLRGIETIATWFSYVVASPAGGGAVDMPQRPIAYFQMTPRKATATRTVTFDSGFSRTKDGQTDGLTYYWDFGDGTPLTMTTNTLIQHTFPQQAGWYDVKLLVGKGGKWGSFRQVEPINFFPTYYPAVAPASEPLPPSSGPAADPCGALTTAEQDAMVAGAKAAKHAPAPNVTLNQLASYGLDH